MAPASKIAYPQPPQEPERHQGENAHVHPRNHQHVISAGALEVGAGGPVDEGVLANHHGVHERGLPLRPQGVDLVDDAAMDARPPEFSPAAGKAGKDFHARGIGRGQRDDPVFRQISPVVERPRIAVVARSRDFGGKPQALTVTEQAVRHLRPDQARVSSVDKHLCASRS